MQGHDAPLLGPRPGRRAGAAGAAGAAGTAGAAGAALARLRLIATSDLHAQLMPHDYYADRPVATGLALAAPLIRALREEAREAGWAALLFDNGDLLQGSLMSDWLISSPDAERLVHPMVQAMTALGYDAAALGNHEFNYGLPFLRRAYAAAAFPVLCANVLGPDGRTLMAPSAILERTARGPDGAVHRLRIGVLGLAPPQIPVWDRRILGGAVATRGILEAAAEEAPRLRDRGADLVVALCHSGLGEAGAPPLAENAGRALAASGLVDALVLGHTHEIFPSPGRPPAEGVDPVRGLVAGVPAMQPGALGSHVGLIDLDLARDRRGRWRVAAASARLVPVAPPPGPGADLPARIDPALAALAAPVHRRLLAHVDEAVGETRVPLHSFLALVGPSPALDVVADAKREHALRLLAGTPAEGLPVLAAVAPVRAGGRAGPGHYVDVPPGPLALRDAASLYVYPNAFALLEVDGAALRAGLERAASGFRTLLAGESDQPLLDPAFPAWQFLSVDGLEWEIDPVRPPRHDAAGRVIDASAVRVGRLAHGGRPVADDDRFVLATNSYGLAAWEAAGRTRRLVESQRLVRDVVLAHVRRRPLDPAPRPRWRFAAHPGTAAWFDTAPAALAHLGAAEGRRLEDLGPAPDGFRRLRLWL